MSAIPKIHTNGVRHLTPENAAFLKYLPAVETHAKIQFRGLNESDREEAIAEAVAAALTIVHAASRNGKTHRLTASSVANFAVLSVKNGGHVGGSADSKKDAMSPVAQRRHGFTVFRLGSGNASPYNCMTDPSRPVWRQMLQEDSWTSPAEQARFRLDLSSFMSGQSDRTRTLLGLLAEGHKQTEVAERMGLTCSALCQRRKRALREWDSLQNPEALPDRTSPGAPGMARASS